MIALIITSLSGDYSGIAEEVEKPVSYTHLNSKVS